MATGTPAVGFVVPIYNAGMALDRTMESLVAQTRGDWTAILVDDGSTDDSRARADDWAVRDPRVRVIGRENGGASAARNTALAALDTPYVVFVDADDWIAPNHLETLVPIAEAAGADALSFCSYVRVSADGVPLPPDFCAALERDAFAVLAERCEPAIHCVVVRRETVLTLGGFDEDLRTCEDWDLWQRIARAGIRFVGVQEPLAFYRMRDGSLSTRYEQVEVDASVVFARGATADPRVPHPDPRYAAGSAVSAALLQLGVLAEAAGAGDADALATLIEQPPLDTSFPAFAAQFINGWQRAHPSAIEAPAAQWPAMAEALAPLFRAIAERPGGEAPARDLRTRFVLSLFDLDPLTVPVRADDWLGVTMPINQLSTVPAPDGVTGLYCRLTAGGEPLGVVALPVFGPVAPATLARAAIENLSVKAIVRGMRARPHFVGALVKHSGRLALAASRREVVGRSGLKRSRSGLVRRLLVDALADTLAGRKIEGSEAIARARASELAERTRAATPAPGIAPVQVHAEELDIDDGRKDYWEHIFANPDPWSYDTPYEAEKYERTMQLVRHEPVRSALELACAEGHFTRRLAGAVDQLLATDISENALSRARERCGTDGNITYRQLDFFEGEIPTGHDLIVCSEVLYFAPDDAQLGRIAHKIAAALSPEGRLVTAHARVLADDLGHTGFDWGDQFGVMRINAAFEAAGLVLEEQLRTELYRISSYRRTDRTITPRIVELPMTDDLEVELRRFIIFGGVAARRSDVADELALRIPVLCLPEIRGDAEVAQLRVILRFLRAHGYTSLRLPELAALQRRAVAANGRPIAIVVGEIEPTLALDTVMPIFQAHDFHATFGLSVRKLAYGAAEMGVAIGATVAHGFDWAVLTDEAALEADVSASLELLATARGRLAAWQGRDEVIGLIEDWAEDPRFNTLVVQAGLAPVIGPAPGFVDVERDEPVWRRIGIDAEDGIGMLCEKLRRDRTIGRS